MTEPVFLPREVPDDLAPVVSAIWYLRAEPARPFEKILPNPRAHLILNLAGPYRQLFRGVTPTGVNLPGAFLAGVQTQYLVNENPPHLTMLVAQFTPEGVGLVARAEPGDIADAVLPADDLLPGVADLVERGRGGEDPAALLDALVELIRSLRRTPGPDAVIARVRAALEDARPASIAGLAESEGLSPRALSAKFVRACGVTPKRFAEVARFDALLTSLADRDPLPTWSELVAEYGYYDQPHVTRAFTRFAGAPPARFLRGLREYGLEYATFVPIDEVSSR